MTAIDKKALEAAIREAVQKIFNGLELVPQDDLDRWIRRHNDVRDERNAARREVEELKGVLAKLEHVSGQEDDWWRPKVTQYRAVLTDTEEAAAQFKRVDKWPPIKALAQGLIDISERDIPDVMKAAIRAAGRRVIRTRQRSAGWPAIRNSSA